MEKEIITSHLYANKNEVSSTVLMMGDPARAEMYAKKFLTNPKLICNKRLINMWSGTYNNQFVTIMSHGMGFSSIGIYVHELFAFYNVKRIVRLGTCAAYKPEIAIGEIILGTKYYTYSVYGESYGFKAEKAFEASPNLLKTLQASFKKQKINYHEGGLYSSSWFYAPKFYNEGIKPNSLIEKNLELGNIIGKEMESYALQMLASYFNCEAITIATVVGNKNDMTSNKQKKINPLLMGKIVFEGLFPNKYSKNGVL